MSFWFDLAGKPGSGYTDKGERSFKPRVRGSNPRAGTPISNTISVLRCPAPVGWRRVDSNGVVAADVAPARAGPTETTQGNHRRGFRFVGGRGSEEPPGMVQSFLTNVGK
jgi:hypothetical protein